MLLNYVTSIYQIKLYNLKNIALCFEIYLCGYALDSHAGDKITSQRCFLTLATPTFDRTNANFFCVYIPYRESISKEMNNDNDLNLHSMTKLSGWLRTKKCRILSWRCHHVPF